MNIVILQGSVITAPELRATGSGTEVLSFKIQTVKRWIRDNEQRESRMTHNVVLWGQAAPGVAAQMSQGSEVIVSGELTNRKWQTKSGEEKWVTEVNARDVSVLGGSLGDGSNDDIPF